MRAPAEGVQNETAWETSTAAMTCAGDAPDSRSAPESPASRAAMAPGAGSGVARDSPGDDPGGAVAGGGEKKGPAGGSADPGGGGAGGVHQPAADRVPAGTAAREQRAGGHFSPRQRARVARPDPVEEQAED